MHARCSPHERWHMTPEELHNRVSQMLRGWKQGCAPGEWSDFDESVLQDWDAWSMAEFDRQQRIDAAIRALEKKAYIGALMVLKHGVPPNEPLRLAQPQEAKS